MNYTTQLRKYATSQYINSAVRIALAIVIPSIILAHFGLLREFFLFPMGTSFVGLTDQPGPFIRRRNTLLLTIVSFFLVVFIFVTSLLLLIIILGGSPLVTVSFVIMNFSIFGFEGISNIMSLIISSIIERNPLAPVFLSIAFSTICSNASSSNSN